MSVDFHKLSVIVSAYNEEAVLDLFYEAIMKELKALDCEYELIFVNDGSSDGTSAILDRFARESESVKVIHFSRNYGHEAAMIAGIDYCSGDGAVCMDADLQHPVECLSKIVEKFREGYEVITMVRTRNDHIPVWKKATSGMFYRLLNGISDTHFDENASDFFAVTSQPIEILKKDYRESKRFLRGYVQDIGFEKTTIEYEAKDRVAGVSKYNFKRLFQFSITALLSFSERPLRIAIIVGAVTGLVCLGGLIAIIVSLLTGNGVSALALVTECFGVLFTILFYLIGILGEYIAVILAEQRERPMYIVRSVRNLEKQ